MERSFAEELAREIGAYRHYFVLGIAFSIVFLLLSVVSLTVVATGSGAYYITIVNIGTLVLVIGLCCGGILIAKRRGR
ncbi:hypothetical protein [Halalkalicoccus subterraneus]|uniref:hypothetical protein n=1 Tax=Halalkalicoccus subterraneus TaxID=2675002 RepID=UPI0013CEB09F|nr:hypothetical protein [Halalkalicoccus subterraneus]